MSEDRDLSESEVNFSARHMESVAWLQKVQRGL